MPIPTLAAVIQSTRKCQVPDYLITLIFDPGETTGWAVFHGQTLKHFGQITAPNRNFEVMVNGCEAKFDKFHPHVVVVEDYKVYAWRVKQHSWAALYTPNLIGAINFMCIRHHLPCKKQMAHEAKVFCTDDKLKAWHCYPVGQKHARDAVRHGLYYLIFGDWERIHAKSPKEVAAEDLRPDKSKTLPNR